MSTYADIHQCIPKYAYLKQHTLIYECAPTYTNIFQHNMMFFIFDQAIIKFVDLILSFHIGNILNFQVFAAYLPFSLNMSIVI